MFEFIKHIPAEVFYVTVAMAGGIARYLSNYTQNGNFSVPMFVASALASSFSGYMFALLGSTLTVSQQLVYMMAGVGGFFGDQAMKFLLEYLQTKTLK